MSHVGASLLVVFSASLMVGTPRAVEGAIELMEEVVPCGHDCKREVASRTRYHVVHCIPWGSTRNGASEVAPTILVLATIYIRQQHTGSHGMRAY